MSQTYVAPEFGKTSFNCPNCGAFAEQKWGTKTEAKRPNSNNAIGRCNDLSVAFCSHCSDYSLWFESSQSMISPTSGTAPLPNIDLPEHIAQDYREARNIAMTSPRGAAALLRLAIQKLCMHLGEPGNDLNKDIGSLVQKGLNPAIQKSLDIVRVIGNESVHPGTIDLRDDPQTASRLFQLINIISDALITQPRMIEETYGILPEGKRDGIEQRDRKTES